VRLFFIAMKLRSNKRFYRIFNLSAELLSKFDSKITLKMIFVYSWKYDEYDIRAGIIAFKNFGKYNLDLLWTKTYSISKAYCLYLFPQNLRSIVKTN